MKKIGIIGGIGWPSTIEYYRHICKLSLAYHANLNITGPAPMPEILIESLNLNFAATNRGTSEPAPGMYGTPISITHLAGFQRAEQS
jgi:aspartate racemase